MTRTLALLVITLASCTDIDCPDCDEGAGGKADETTPSSGAATLVVTAPVGSAPVKVFARRKSTAISVELTLGVAKTVGSGTYCINTELAGQRLQEDCSVTVPADVTTTYALGTFAFVHGRDELVFGVDVAPATILARTLAAQTLPIPHAAGTFSYELDAFGTFQLPLHVSRGQHTDFDLMTLAADGGVRLLPSAPRLLPNASDSAPTFAVCVETNGAFGARRCGEFHPSSKPWLITKGLNEPAINLRSPQSFSIKYREIAFPETPTVIDVQMKRIDLNHVRVTLADGTVQAVPGVADIVMVNGANSFNPTLIAAQPTGYGVDVPPAVYRVTTRFTNPIDGLVEHVEQSLDLR